MDRLVTGHEPTEGPFLSHRFRCERDNDRDCHVWVARLILAEPVMRTMARDPLVERETGDERHGELAERAVHDRRPGDAAVPCIVGDESELREEQRQYAPGGDLVQPRSREPARPKGGGEQEE